MSEVQHSYTSVYPVTIDSHDPPCDWCGGEVKPHFAASDLDLCTVCATPRVRPTAKPTAAAARNANIRNLFDEVLKDWRRVRDTEVDSRRLLNDQWKAERAITREYVQTMRARLDTLLASRDASLSAYVDDLLDLLQDVGGMSAEWCETRLQAFEALLREG